MAAVSELQSAFAKRDIAAICARVTPTAARQAGSSAHGTPTKCIADVRKVIDMIERGGGWKHSGDAQPVEVRIAGDRATATMARDVGRPFEVPFLRQDGVWKLDSFFGTAPAEAESFQYKVAEFSFPSPHGAPVDASHRGKPCGDFAGERRPVRKGCVLHLTSRPIALDIDTIFGQFRFEKCILKLQIRIDSQGRTWTDQAFFLEDPNGVGQSPCGDVHQCIRNPTDNGLPTFKDFLALRGRIRATSDPNQFTHHTDACIATCIGYYAGEIAMTLNRHGNRWQAAILNPGVGTSGLHFTGDLTIKNTKLDLQQLARGRREGLLDRSRALAAG